MTTRKFSISLPEMLLEELTTHFGSNRSAALQRMISRYTYILYTLRSELRSQFSDNELALILDACNGVAFMEIVSMRLLWANIADGIEIDQLDEKWKVDGDELISRLRGLSLMENIALVDAIKCWWDRVGNGDQPEYGEMLDVPEHTDLLIL